MKLELKVSDVGITPETGQKIWELARETLGKYGMVVTHPRLWRNLQGRAGLGFDKDRVFISPTLFESKYPSPGALRRKNGTDIPSAPPPASGSITVNAGGYSMNVVDWRNGEVRSATVQDLAESVRVVEACGSSGPYPVTPQDVPPLLRDIVTYKTCFENGKSIRGSFYSAPEQAPFIEEMCEVMGEPFSLILGVVSPLRMSDGDIDNIYRTVSRGKRHRIRIIGYGVPGVGSPATLAASAALVMAENYGAAILLSLVFPDNPICVSVNPGGATDFRHCNYAQGAPHAFAYNVINSHILAAIRGAGSPERVGLDGASLFTGACLPDEQAAAEKMSHALTGALLGLRNFRGAGNLCMDDVFSLEQFMVDREIAAHAVKMVECCAPSAVMADLSGFMDEMQDTLAGVAFLAQPSTLKVMRAFYRPGAMFEHMKLPSWQAGGCRTVRQKAREMIECKLAASHFEIAPEKAGELTRIYTAAEQAMRTAPAT